MGVHSVHIRGAFLFNSFGGENIPCLSPSMALGRSFCFADQVCSVERKRYPPKKVSTSCSYSVPETTLLQSLT
jgi:hypothetical protein